MKKMFFYASLLLAAATLNSCSQDSDLAADEAATAAAGALTPEQRAQVMELAEYYGLDVTIDDRPATRGVGQEFNIDSVEALFRHFASMRGTFSFDVLDGKPVEITLPQQKIVRLARISSNSLENGPTHKEYEMSANINYWILIVIDCSAGGVLSVKAYETATARPLTVNLESGGLMPNGDFSGYYRIDLNYPTFSGLYHMRLKVDTHDGRLDGSVY